MKRFIYLLILSLFTISTLAATGVAYEAEPFAISGYTYEDIELLQVKITEQQARMSAASDIISAARSLGYDNSHDVIELARCEYQTCEKERDYLQTIYKQLQEKWNRKRVEYPDATFIWERLKEAGYSNYICAGIIGNIMNEVGGNTLNIQPCAQTAKYYGICQWSSYYPDAWGLSVEEQCDYLLNSMEEIINAFGSLYKQDFGYQDFVCMTNCRQIALCFAKSYERCSTSSYLARQENATIAYDYFIS